jgi:hypothetical protein
MYRCAVPKTRIIDSHKSVPRLVQFPSPVHRNDIFQHNWTLLKQRLVQETCKPIEFETIREIEVVPTHVFPQHDNHNHNDHIDDEGVDDPLWQDPWTLYLCSTHSHNTSITIPRNLFTMIIHYISNSITSPPTLNDRIVRILSDLKNTQWELSELEIRLLVLSVQKCRLMETPGRLLDVCLKWPMDRDELFRFLVLILRRYVELNDDDDRGRGGGGHLILNCLIENGFLKDYHVDILTFCVNVDINKYPLIPPVLKQMLQDNLEIPPLLYSQLLSKSFHIVDNDTIIDYLLELYMKQEMHDPVHFQFLLQHCRDRKKYRMADMVWSFGNQYRYDGRKKKRRKRVFIDVPTCLLYCDILLSQKRMDEASLVFRGIVATLPNPLKKGSRKNNNNNGSMVDLHGLFLSLCIDHGCIELFKEYLALIHDSQINISQQTINEMIEKVEYLERVGIL